MASLESASRAYRSSQVSRCQARAAYPRLATKHDWAPLHWMEFGNGLHRLCIAISREEGQTLTIFITLESLHDQTVVATQPPERIKVIE